MTESLSEALEAALRGGRAQAASAAQQRARRMLLRAQDDEESLWQLIGCAKGVQICMKLIARSA
jgi:hypothetical protein